MGSNFSTASEEESTLEGVNEDHGVARDFNNPQLDTVDGVAGSGSMVKSDNVGAVNGALAHRIRENTGNGSTINFENRPRASRTVTAKNGNISNPCKGCMEKDVELKHLRHRVKELTRGQRELIQLTNDLSANCSEARCSKVIAKVRMEQEPTPGTKRKAEPTRRSSKTRRLEYSTHAENEVHCVSSLDTSNKRQDATLETNVELEEFSDASSRAPSSD